MIDVDHPRCPFCHADVTPGQGEKRSCADCMAWHHQECWEDHGGCSACNQTCSATSSRRAPPAKEAGPRSPRVALGAFAALIVVGLGALVWLPSSPTAASASGTPGAPAVDKGWYLRFLAAETEEDKTRWCREGAEGGDPAAMNLLGFRLAGGIGCAQDFEEAAGWGRKGAELGHSNAMFGYARMLEGGFGVEQDLAGAADWYRRALEAGDPQAPHHLEALLRKHPELR